jgi:hypothetical protein
MTTTTLALLLATLATLAGGLLSVWPARSLVQTFSGNGLISAGATRREKAPPTLLEKRPHTRLFLWGIWAILQIALLQ